MLRGINIIELQMLFKILNSHIFLTEIGVEFCLFLFFCRGPRGYGCRGRCYYWYCKYSGPGHCNGQKKLVICERKLIIKYNCDVAYLHKHTHCLIIAMWDTVLNRNRKIYQKNHDQKNYVICNHIFIIKKVEKETKEKEFNKSYIQCNCLFNMIH